MKDSSRFLEISDYTHFSVSEKAHMAKVIIKHLQTKYMVVGVS